jgi:hypothetical protein
LHALETKGIGRNMSLYDGSLDKIKEIGLHLADLLIKGGVNIKEKKTKQHVPMLYWKKQVGN